MLNHYDYFIALAEERSISKAAERLFISHQCLSKYLKNLEQSYQIALFERKPHFQLTEAGKAYLDMLRQVQLLEKNTENRMADIRHSQEGLIRFGTTEGRYRVLIPQLISRYQKLYPDVRLETYCATTNELYERLEANQLDLVLLNFRDRHAARFETQTLLQETMYLVASDGLLAKYFPESYPECLETFRGGVDLAEFEQRRVPFVQTPVGFNSRDAVDELCRRRGIPHPDVGNVSAGHPFPPLRQQLCGQLLLFHVSAVRADRRLPRGQRSSQRISGPGTESRERRDPRHAQGQDPSRLREGADTPAAVRLQGI